MSQTPPEPSKPEGGPYSEDHARALIESYRNEAAHAENERAARLLHEAARLYEDVLNDRRSAGEAVQEALALDGSSPALLHTALRLSHAEGNLQQTAALLRRSAEVAGNLGARVGLLMDLADLQEFRLGDEEQATETYERIRAEDPANLSATEGLLRFQIGKGRWEQVAKLCHQLADTEEEAQSRGSLLLIAALLIPGRGERMKLLSQCLATGQVPDLVVTLLATLPETREEWDDVVRQLLARTEASPTATLHYQISQILSDQLARTAEAIEQAQQAVDLRQEELALWDWQSCTWRWPRSWTDDWGAPTGPSRPCNRRWP